MKRPAPVSVLVAISCLSSTALAVGEAVSGFPNWQERVIHEWMNRARCDPKVEMMACGNNCPEGMCYTPVNPLVWDEKLNRAARFHSAAMVQQGFFAHDSACTLVGNINAIYPGACNGAASCACQGGVKQCMGSCTSWSQRISLFGASPGGEIIASPGDPNQAFYLWLYEPFNKSACKFDFGPPTNGHRWNILKAGPLVGNGVTTADAVGDFGGGNAPIPKIPSGSHYPRQSASIEAWANWFDGAGPQSALIDVDGVCSPMSLKRGTTTNGAYQTTLTTFANGCHRYYFVFKDSMNNLVTYPTTGSLGIGPSNCADWDSSRPPMGMGCSCAPQCNGKQCGDDGCGGSCGACGQGQMCASGQCVGSNDDGGAPLDGGSGSGGDDSGASGDSGATGNNGSNGGNNNLGEDGGLGAQNGAWVGGCSCDASSSNGSAGWLALLALAPLLRRRQRVGSKRSART